MSGSITLSGGYVQDTIHPGDLVKNPFKGEFCLYNIPTEDGALKTRTVTVHTGSVGLVLAVSGSYIYVLIQERLGWCPFGMFDRVLP